MRSAAKVTRASTRLFVPEGFSGWWCERCVKPVTLPDELGSPARCPCCRKPTAVWVPEVRSAECGARNSEYVRQVPRAERGKALFAHLHAVIEHPELNPDLRAIEHEDYRR